MNKTKRIREILCQRNCDLVIAIAELEDFKLAPSEIKQRIVGELSDEFETYGCDENGNSNQYGQEIESLIASLYPI